MPIRPVARTSVQRVKLKHLAQRLQLSPTAVSLALNNRGREFGLPDATVRRVRDLAQQMGYIRDAEARALRVGRPGAIALARAATGWDPWDDPRLLGGIQAVCSRHGLPVTILPHPGEHLPWSERDQRDLSAAGIIGLGGMPFDEVERERLNSNGVPIVSVGGREATNAVRVDYRGPIEALTARLVGEGLEEFRFVRAPHPLRAMGAGVWREVWEACGRSALQASTGRHVVEQPVSCELEFPAARELIDSMRERSALFVGDLQLAILIRLLLRQESGMQGFRGKRLFLVGDVPPVLGNAEIETIGCPWREVGECAAEMLLRRLEEGGAEMKTVIVPARVDPLRGSERTHGHES